MNRREDTGVPLLKCKDLTLLPTPELEELRQSRYEELHKQQGERRRRGRGPGGDVNPGVIRNCKKEIARINTVLAGR